MEITTTGLISNIQDITTKKLKTQTLIQNLEQELRESNLQVSLNTEKEYLRELEKEEVEIRNNGIKVLQDAGIVEFTGSGVTIKVKTLPGKLVILEEELIPDEYKKTTTKTTTTVDKKLIKENMKEGEIIDGCKLEQEIKLEVKHL